MTTKYHGGEIIFLETKKILGASLVVLRVLFTIIVTIIGVKFHLSVALHIIKYSAERHLVFCKETWRRREDASFIGLY